MLTPRVRKWEEKTRSATNTHLREQHTDLLHLFNGEQRVARRMFKQYVQQHLHKTNNSGFYLIQIDKLDAP